MTTPHTAVKNVPSMKSVRYHGPGDIRVEQISEPICGKEEVKVYPDLWSCLILDADRERSDLHSLEYVAVVCLDSLVNLRRKAEEPLTTIDLHEYSGGPILIPQKPHSITGTRRPVTLGHEFGGTVEEVGEDVSHVSHGQRVVVRPTIVDHTCTACRMGYEYCCENIGFIGLSGYGGGMANYTTAPAGHIYPLPDKISLEAAALIEPLAVSWHAVNESPFKANDNVLIIGGGPISIGTVQVLKLQGAKNIIVSEMMERRKQFSKQHGATHVLDPGADDIPKQVHKITGGVGADVAFDTAGVEVALNAAIDSCHAHGSIVNIAVWNKPPAIHVNSLMYQEMRYMGVTLYDEQSFVDVIRALQYGQLQPEDMITDKIKMDEVVKKGFEVLLGPERNDHCKILVDAQT